MLPQQLILPVVNTPHTWLSAALNCENKPGGVFENLPQQSTVWSTLIEQTKSIPDTTCT